MSYPDDGRFVCVDCRQPITGIMVGAGDGTGQRFRCRECDLRHRLLELRGAVEETLPLLRYVAGVGPRLWMPTPTPDRARELLRALEEAMR